MLVECEVGASSISLCVGPVRTRQIAGKAEALLSFETKVKSYDQSNC